MASDRARTPWPSPPSPLRGHWRAEVRDHLSTAMALVDQLAVVDPRHPGRLACYRGLYQLAHLAGLWGDAWSRDAERASGEDAGAVLQHATAAAGVILDALPGEGARVRDAFGVLERGLGLLTADTHPREAAA